MKVGIISHYYKSENFGGLLQAFALQKYIESNGLSCKQICYKKQFSLTVRSKIKELLKKVVRFLLNLFHLKSFVSYSFKKKKIKKFRDCIPHTKRVFKIKNLFKANNDFDVFVTGSDQVWSPSVIDDAYLLNFTKKIRISYAASVAASSLNHKELLYLSDSLQEYKAISVRERTSIDFIPANLKPKLVLDPVFLLRDKEWCSVASNRMVKSNYLLCYFLGFDPKNINLIKMFAKENKLKIVNICYSEGFYKKVDFSFADLNLINLSPNDFLSLIKNSDIVFTDSFHAIAFSYIFKKQFYVFNRKSKTDMSSRIKDLLVTLNLENRFVDKSIERCQINYKNLSVEKIEKMRFDSMRFLNEGIGYVR